MTEYEENKYKLKGYTDNFLNRDDLISLAKMVDIAVDILDDNDALKILSKQICKNVLTVKETQKFSTITIKRRRRSARNVHPT